LTHLSDFYDKTPEERWLVHKLDCTLLTVLTFGWLMKYIDQSNLSKRY
jgi:glutamyl/glutaminyl-tRNA synthetase